MPLTASLPSSLSHQPPAATTHAVAPHTPKIVVLGTTGQLGKALLQRLGGGVSGDQGRVLSLSRSQADFSQPQQVIAALDQLAACQVQPLEAVFIAAAYTQVDLAETQVALATTINAETPGLIAQWCERQKLPCVYFSSDYVFNGSGEQPWQETDATQPLNAYGRSKLLGEQRVSENCSRFLIFRTSWVYDATGKNFLTTMLRLGRQQKALKVVADQWGAPTFAADLAEASFSALDSAKALDGAFPSGVYHCCNQGTTHWWGFAEALFQEARQLGHPSLLLEHLEQVPSSAYPTAAQRPLNSRLNTDRLQRVLGVRLPPWREAMTRCLTQLLQPTAEVEVEMQASTDPALPTAAG